ncbi:MAG: excinuclease ABC subunit UvrA [Clostridia bacterium]|nr:excinuclease ABC subunit UvrA [Clostridia bacterium]
MDKFIKITGARSHNLKNVSLTIPRNKLVVFTGLSGSGKSSLAFDTIYAEGQRRYMESLSSYARMFLGQMEKPDVDSIEGLSPAISIDQKSTSNNPRSTVGTITEVHDYLRLLYARIGVPHCPECGRVIERQTIDNVTDSIKELGEGTKFQILAPAVRGRKGEYQKLLEQLRKQGFTRVIIDSVTYMLDDEMPNLEKNIKHTIDIVIDRLVLKEGIDTRLNDSLETAFKYGEGLAKVIVMRESGDEELLFSQNYSCPECGISIEELEPRIFSFNNPFGACPVCTGLGLLRHVSEKRVVTNPDISLNEGAITVSGWNSETGGGAIAAMYLQGLSEHYGFSLDTPWKDLPKKARHAVLYGTGNERIRVSYDRDYGSASYVTRFEGIIPNLERRYRDTQSEEIKRSLEVYMVEEPCSVCKGKRLKKESLAVTVSGKNIAELSDMPISEARDFINSVQLSPSQKIIADRIMKELNSRLGFLVNVGLDYLTLSRYANSLSGGESQRIRLATQIGSGLVGVLYILDEPSIGLHQRDNRKLLDSLCRMRDLGNTLIVVEHDEETMLSADYIVDIGPGAGSHGGEIVAAGTPDDIKACKDSVTGQFLSGERSIKTPKGRRSVSDKFITVHGARENNLKNLTVKLPLGVFTCITGVSGSGKSSLVNRILRDKLLAVLNHARTSPGDFDSIEGVEALDKIIDIDQSPIGRTPRSNAATYTGLFDLIRDLFSQTPDARVRGYSKGRFSFNVKGGRCEACAGDGIKKIEMHFLPDVYVPCEVCHGKRYNRETLEVKYKGKSISDVLDMTVDEALVFFANLPKLKRKLQTLQDVGLGYITLGQSATTLSGGEAQRVKLATELSRTNTGKTLYVLDEPTTGLHMADVEKLIEIIQRLCDSGSTIVVIEHNLDVIKCADYIIDMGPEGGDKGGTVVACGTPEQVAENEKSYTGQYLSKILSK